MTPLAEVARRLGLVWGVEALIVEPTDDFEALLEVIERRIVAEEIALPGDTIAVTSGMPVGQGGTNVLKLHHLP